MYKIGKWFLNFLDSKPPSLLIWWPLSLPTYSPLAPLVCLTTDLQPPGLAGALNSWLSVGVGGEEYMGWGHDLAAATPNQATCEEVRAVCPLPPPPSPSLPPGSLLLLLAVRLVRGSWQEWASLPSSTLLCQVPLSWLQSHTCCGCSNQGAHAPPCPPQHLCPLPPRLTCGEL